MSYILAFDLDEDVRHPGCPACRAAARVGRKYLASLMASDITDARVVERICRTGLCREHLLHGVEVVEATGDTMGMAILSDLLLAAAESPLAARVRSRSSWIRGRTGRRQLPLGAGCPACAAEAVVIDGYLDLLLSTSSHHLMGALSGPERGLCLAHAYRSLERPGAEGKGDAIIRAWSTTAQHYRRLLAELIRKRSHQYRHEPAGSEADAWRQAPSWLVGAPRSGEGARPPAGRWSPRRST